MTKQQMTNLIPFEDVAEEIEKMLFNEKKAAIIKDKIVAIDIQDKSLYQIKQSYGSEAFVFENEDLQFASNQIRKSQTAPRAVGAAFALEIGQRTTIIQDESGIFIIERLPNSTSTQKTQNKNAEEAMTAKQMKLIEAILTQQTIKDERYKFYD